MSIKKFQKIFSANTLILILILTFSISFVVYAWTEPNQPPPGGNVPAPINTGGVGQVKRYVDASNRGWLGIGVDNYDSNYSLTVGYVSNKLGIKVRGNSYFQGAANDGTAALSVANDAGTNLLYVRNDGNVGIGTTAPWSKLTIQSAAGAAAIGFDVTGWGNAGNIRAYNGGGLQIQPYSPGWTAIGLYLAPNSGNVGIGTTGPAASLHVAGGDIELSDGTSGFRLHSRAGTAYDFFQLAPKTGGTIDWSRGITLVRSTGNVGIGTTNPSSTACGGGACRLDVNGSVRATSFYYGSDVVLKENIKPLSNSLFKILQLQGVSFNWKKTGQSSIGLVAQDVEKIFPEIVSTDEQGIKNLEYPKLIAPLIEAIKEQQKTIEDLKKEIDELKLMVK